MVLRIERMVSMRKQRCARDYVTDWLGSALAGHTTEPGKMLLDYAAAQTTLVRHVIGRELCFQ